MDNLIVMVVNLTAGVFGLYVAIHINTFILSPLLVVLSLLNFFIAGGLLWEAMTED